MASVKIQTLLKDPEEHVSQERSLEFLNAKFTTLQDLEGLSHLEEIVKRAKEESNEIGVQLSQSRQTVDTLLAETRTSALTHLSTAQDLSLLRHSLSDELSHLSQQLVSSLVSSDGKPTLLEDLETLHRNLKELESVKGYVQVVEHCLNLSEAAIEQIRGSSSLSSTDHYEALQHFILSVRRACSPAEDVAGQQKLHIVSFLDTVRVKTWQCIKNALSTTLLNVADKLHWPMPVDYLSAAPDDRKAFESAFLNLLKLQTIGKRIHGIEDVEKEGLYPIQALVQAVSLRFKYHFEGTRQTNRLDKPEWYFTHILNVSHEHRRFMESVIQAILSNSEYRDIDAWREFTLLLLPLIERKLRRTVPSLLAHPPILAHTIYEALAFDTALRDEDFDIVGSSAGSKVSDRGEQDKEDKNRVASWEGISNVILGNQEWFETWMEGERKFAMEQYMETITAPDAWLIADDDGLEGDTVNIDRELKPTISARRVKALVEQITDRYSPLPQFLHRTRFLIAVQLPILESYQSRISSSLDAFETLSSSFMRAVPGALGSVGVSSEGSRPGGSKRLTSGVEGVQRLSKALISAKYMGAACEAWGEDLFFLELWTEINHRASLRSRVMAQRALPDPKGSEIEAPEGIIFEELVTQFRKLVERAEDMITHSVCGEIETALKPHFSGGSSTKVTPNANMSIQDDIALSPTLLGPIAMLSSHITFLQSTLPRANVTNLYRRIASHISEHILQRQIFYRGRGRISAQEGKAFLAESELWVETCQLALARNERARVEGPWRGLLQASRLVASDGVRWQKIVDATFGVTPDPEWEQAMLESIGFADLSRDEVRQILSIRVDCER